MKHFLSNNKRRFLLFLLIPVLLLPSFFLFWERDAYRFQKLADTMFCQEMERDTLSMHYILASPQTYGLSETRAVLPLYSKENRQDSIKRLNEKLDELTSIKKSRLKSEDARTYTLLLSFLENEKLTASFPYYEEPLSPSSGVPVQLPILLAEYTFRSEQDVKNYLSLLEQLPAYFDSLLLYEKEKAAAGLFMPDSAADKVIEQCSSILDADSLKKGSHFLHTTFSKRLEELVAKGLLNVSQKEAYLEKNNTLLTKAVGPAYERLGNSLSSLKGSGCNEEGLSHYPQGREYYTCLLRKTTGSGRNVNEIKKLLLKQFQSDCQSLSSLLQKYPNLLQDMELSFPLTQPEQMLSHLQKAMQEDFPAFPANTKELPTHSLKQVSENMEAYASPAFYLTPPIDDVTENSIYINYKNNPQGLELYTTLAHEGYPGHLYQTVYYQLFQKQSGIHPVRNLIYCGGYVEGWALYVEMLSYEYAASLALQNGAEEKTLLSYKLEALDRSMQLCLYSLLDLAIHYDGASYETIHTLLSSFGIDSPNITKNIYEYIREEPATYPKYYVGYLEILALKEKAKKSWGNSYHDRNFHQFLLECGPCPFGQIEKLL